MNNLKFQISLLQKGKYKWTLNNSFAHQYGQYDSKINIEPRPRIIKDFKSLMSSLLNRFKINTDNSIIIFEEITEPCEIIKSIDLKYGNLVNKVQDWRYHSWAWLIEEDEDTL